MASRRLYDRICDLLESFRLLAGEYVNARPHSSFLG
jgi:hypothetical protein